MKKVAFLIPSPTPDHAPLFRKITGACPDVELTVYFFHDFRNADLNWDATILEGYRYKFLKNISPRPSLESFWGLVNPAIIMELRRGGYDAVLVNGYASYTAWLSLLTARISGIPVIFRGEADLSNQRSALKRLLKKTLLVPLLKGMRAVLYSCEANKRYYRHYGVPVEKLFFFPSAVDNDYWRPRAEELLHRKAESKRELGIPRDTPVVLSVAGLTPVKRPLDLLKASERLTKEGFAHSLVFVGNGPLADDLKKYAVDHELKNVLFAGSKKQDELAVFYSIADVLALASEWDRSPKVFHEGMTFGLPLVASDTVGTAPDLIDEGGAGLIYPKGDIDELAHSIKTILTNEELAEKMKRATLDLSLKWSFEEDVKGFREALFSKQDR